MPPTDVPRDPNPRDPHPPEPEPGGDRSAAAPGATAGSRATRAPADDPERPHLAIAGGGLQGALIALAVLARDPGARVTLVERGAALGGNHTWCFHSGDVPAAAREWLEPLVEFRWSGHSVRFPDHARELDGAYACLRAGQLDRTVRAALDRAPSARLRTGAEIRAVDAGGLVLADGERIEADRVVDARGPDQGPPPGAAGFQKFVGLELELEAPHGLERPLLMDACVDQAEGYRFVYVLPFDDRRVLVEDTRFTDSPELDVAGLTTEVERYARARGWRIARVGRRETGVLPMPWAGPDPATDCAPLRAGYRGHWFHPGTGYSFGIALRLAEAVAEAWPERPDRAVADLARRLAANLRYARFLNRLLFRWYPAHRRWRIFARFYRLPEPTIGRFYALGTTALDRVRILVGRPPGMPSLAARLRSTQRPNVLVRS